MKTLRLHPQDNLLVALDALPKGCELSADFKACNDIPKMHKVASQTIAAGEKILKYGQVIGQATQSIAAGEHIHTHNCAMGNFERDFAFCSQIRPTQFVPTNAKRQFQGYHRPSGKVGTRNFIALVTTVNCSATAARHIAEQARLGQLLDGFDNIDGIVPLVHSSGCGMNPNSRGGHILARTLAGYAVHPNFGGVITLGLGCEAMQLNHLMRDYGLVESEFFRAYNIQDVDGTAKAIDHGLGIIREMLPRVNAVKRQATDASHLTLAVQCGGSDAFSGITANPALGKAADTLVAQGGTVIYSETPEIYGAEHLLTQRAETPESAQAIVDLISWWENYTLMNGVELNNNPSPGNKAGGLTTILEKSLGAMAKAGSTNLRAVYQYAEQVKEKGMVFMDSPGFDPVSVTGQVASGANVVCFTTGRGSAFGHKPVPSLKLASNTALYERMTGDIDINCGKAIEGGSLEASGAEIFETILRVASGERTKSELLGYGDNEFTPWPMGAVV
ncbi:altronate dehydratase family protein [Simiduia litorea]